MAISLVRASAAALFAATLCIAAAAAAKQPNIVLILTDDEDVAIHETMPKTRALLHERGTTFTSFITSYPFCCPSRASILRGQYAHNTQVVGNEMPYGGYEKLRQRGLERSTVATWLREAGYRTALVGKYINRYDPETAGVPPGWSEWYVGGNAHVSYDYVLNENGATVRYGSEPQDYLNDVLTAKSVGVIERAAAAGEPFFLYVSTYTPHSPAVAAPRHVGINADAVLPRPPSFDVAGPDKPAFVRLMPRIEGRRLAHMEAEYRRRLDTMLSIDDMVAEIVEALAAAGVLDDTYIVYTSDNGFHMGEHRLPAGKDFPYEEDILVPTVIRGPGVPQGTTVDALAMNIDLAPTFAAIAGVEPPDFVDGRSLLPLIADPHRPWRQSLLLERRQFESQYVDVAATHGLTGAGLERAAQFDGLRTARWTYVEYGTGERELYDLQADPHQMTNLVESADARLVAALSERLARLAACAGAACRVLEDLPVAAPGPVAGGAPAALPIPAAAKR